MNSPSLDLCCLVTFIREKVNFLFRTLIRCRSSSIQPTFRGSPGGLTLYCAFPPSFSWGSGGTAGRQFDAPVVLEIRRCHSVSVRPPCAKLLFGQVTWTWGALLYAALRLKASYDMRGSLADKDRCCRYVVIRSCLPFLAVPPSCYFLADLAFVFWAQASGMCIYWIIRACS